jgi:hypothetical protein
MQQHALEFFGAVFAFIGILNISLPRGDRRGGVALLIGGIALGAFAAIVI